MIWNMQNIEIQQKGILDGATVVCALCWAGVKGTLSTGDCSGGV